MSVRSRLSAAAAILTLGLAGHSLAQETVSAPSPIPADIITPEFVEGLRQQLQQPVTILSV